MRAGAHHDDAVADADQLHQLGLEMTTTALALARQLLDQEIDVALGADVDAARRLVEHHHFRGPGCSTLASASFCWLPPDSDDALMSSEPVRMPNSATADLQRVALGRRLAATAFA